MGYTLPPGVNEHLDFDLNGETELRIFTSFGQRVLVHQITFVGDTPTGPAPAADWAPSPYNPPDPAAPADPANPKSVAVGIDPNRPGPLAIPTKTIAGHPVRGGSLRYSTVGPDGKPGDGHAFRVVFR